MVKSIIIGCLLLVSPVLSQAQTSSSLLMQMIEEGENFHYQRVVGNPDAGPGFPDLSPEQIQKREAYWLQMIERLDSLGRHLDTEEDKINYQIYRFIVADRLANYKYQYYLLPLNAEGGFLTSLNYWVDRTKIGEEADFDRYFNRLKDLPRYLQQQEYWLDQGQKKGFVLPKVLFPNILNLLDQIMGEDVNSCLFYQPVAKIKETTPTRTWDLYDRKLRQEIQTATIPALKRLRLFLKIQYGPACSETIGMRDQPKGEAMYQQRIQYFTTLDMTPEEVASLGQQEVARIRAEMESIIKGLEFKGTFADFLEFLRTDPQFYASSPGALLKEAAWISKRIEAKLPAYFGKLPRQPFTVAPVPDAIAPSYTGGRYVPGNMSRGNPGTYWVNTYNLKSRPLYVLPSLSLHEAVPGHHLQMALTSELEDLPAFRRSLYISAFGEGWALYTEYLGQEMGIYQTPYEEFGKLTYEMWRACRLVVDVGMHYQGMTRAEAVKFMAENTALSLHEVNTEIDRYIGWPGQAVSYKIGELAIRKLRDEQERKFGTEFDIRAFHDKLLSKGTIPLFLLENMFTN